MIAFSKHTEKIWADLLANYLPPGRNFIAGKINGTVQRGILLTFSASLKEIEDDIVDIVNKWPAHVTDIFLEEWEIMLGIPDDCLPRASGDAERRENILFKLRAIAIVSKDDFLAIAVTFGETIQVVNLIDAALPFSLPFTVGGGTNKDARIVLIGGQPSEKLQCVFNKLKPIDGEFCFLENACVINEC